MSDFQIPVLGFAAWSGTGKTTLLKKLLPILKERGIRLAVVKHAHHNFEADKPGKDSYELRKAGAAPMLISSSRRMAMMLDYEQEAEPVLADMIDYLPLHKIDAVLVEGFKQESFPKIELHRPAVEKPLICPHDPDIIALATEGCLLPEDVSLSDKHHDRIVLCNPDKERILPLLDLNNTDQLADFVVEQIARQKRALCT